MAQGWRPPQPIEERLREKSRVRPDGCWEWTAYRGPTGYGRLTVGSRLDGTRRCALAHRVSYEHFIGPVPGDLELDHLCRNRACINPTHMEPVTHRENLLRSENFTAEQARRTHCPQGHPYDAENTRRTPNGGRACRACYG